MVSGIDRYVMWMCSITRVAGHPDDCGSSGSHEDPLRRQTPPLLVYGPRGVLTTMKGWIDNSGLLICCPMPMFIHVGSFRLTPRPLASINSLDLNRSSSSHEFHSLTLGSGWTTLGWLKVQPLSFGSFGPVIGVSIDSINSWSSLFVNEDIVESCWQICCSTSGLMRLQKSLYLVLFWKMSRK